MATPSNGSNRQTLVLDREAVVEAVAAMDAASSVVVSFNHGQDTPGLDDFLSRAAWTLHAAAFGKMEEQAPTDPALVDVYVRAYQIAADLLAPVADRAKLYADEARKFAEAGTIDLRPAVDPALGAEGGEPR